jgi:hypothetical protein
MIVATRLSAVWQVAGVALAALCCYLVSQSVASQRAGLEQVDRQIASTHDDIAKLQTEIGVRARQGQLEAWNREVLALQAPRPSQFVSSGVQLASLYGHRGQPALQLDPAIAVQQGSPTNVAYHPAPAPAPQAAAPVSATADAPVAAQPMLRTATYVRPAPSRLGAPAGADAVPTVQKASFELVKPQAPTVHIDIAAPKPMRTAAKSEAKPAVKSREELVRLAARDPLPKSLLPADIGALAAREAKGTKDSFKATR